MQRRFFKLFGIMFIVMMVFALILFTVQILHGDFGGEEEVAEPVEQETAYYSRPQADTVGEFRFAYSCDLSL